LTTLVLGGTDFFLFWHGANESIVAASPDALTSAGTGRRKKEQKILKKCILAVDGFDCLNTLPARLKRDSQVARCGDWFWPGFGTANWNSILSRFITP
jgi:hypothetical protein